MTPTVTPIYMDEYHLTPDELIAKAFRMIQSSRRGYYPNGKSEWIAAMKNLYKREARSLPDISKTSTKIHMSKGITRLSGTQ
jgi:hypothetical protein